MNIDFELSNERIGRILFNLSISMEFGTLEDFSECEIEGIIEEMNFLDSFKSDYLKQVLTRIALDNINMEFWKEEQ